MQSYVADGPVTATPYAGETEVSLEAEPIHSRKNGETSEVIAT
jgi:arylsulfatase